MQPNRDLGSLSPIMLYPFREWRAAAQAWVPHVKLRVSEARRSAERQAFLWAQGRQPPYLGKPKVTWERESLHQWGLAVDWFVERDGVAVWDRASYEHIYRLVPPEDFGLRSFATDLVHLEFYFGDAAVEHARGLGLWRA